MRTIVGIPAHDGRVLVETADGLLQCRDLYESVVWIKGCCFASAARNNIVHKFMAGPWDRLLFIDTDIVFERKHMKQLLDHDSEEIVAGIYAARTMEDHRVFIRPVGEKIKRGFNLCEAAATGFMLIHRKAVEKIMAIIPDQWMWEGKDKTDKVFDLFPCGRVISDHDWTSDDFAFCSLARKAGVGIWCDTDVAVGHMGQVVFGVQ